MAHRQLRELSDWHLVHPEQDIRGYRVVDENGTEISRVDELLVSTDSELVEVIRLTNGDEYDAKDIAIGDKVVYVRAAAHATDSAGGQVVKSYTDARIHRRGADTGAGAAHLHDHGLPASGVVGGVHPAPPVGAATAANTGATLAGTAGTLGGTTGTRPILGSEHHEIATSPTVPTGFNEYHNDFLSHYNTTYGSHGRAFSDYGTAYQYGYGCGIDQRYEGREFVDVEPELQRDYEGRHGNGTWENVKDAVRHSFQRGRGRMSTGGRY